MKLIAKAVGQLGPVHLGVRVDPAAHGLDRIALGKPREKHLLWRHACTVAATALLVYPPLMGEGQSQGAHLTLPAPTHVFWESGEETGRGEPRGVVADMLRPCPYAPLGRFVG